MTVLLGVADSISKDFFEHEYTEWNDQLKIFHHYNKSLNQLLEFLELKKEILMKEITDFISIEPSFLDKKGYGHSLKMANELGFTNIRTHLVDLGGASVTAAIGQAKCIIDSEPDSVVLIAGADIPKSLIKNSSDLKRVNEFACHPEYELKTGATLISMYALLMKRMMFEENITNQDLEEITKLFRKRAIGNPRAVNFGNETTQKQLSRKISDPYSSPMIAVVTDHGFATLLVSEKKAIEWQKNGISKKQIQPVYVVGAEQTSHSEYFIFKGNFETPSFNSAEKLFSRSGFHRSEVDYAWIYDCFTGMMIRQSSEYFQLPIPKVLQSLKNGELELSRNKKIKINLLGGLLNYQAAMSISAATGLVDIASQFGLYAQGSELGNSEFVNPKICLLGGNGGIDSVNSVALFSKEKHRDLKDPIQPKLKPLTLNRIDADSGEMGTIWSYTTVNFNPGSSKKTPYVLGLIQLVPYRFVIANLIGKDGERITNADELVLDRTKLKIEKNLNGWNAII